MEEERQKDTWMKRDINIHGGGEAEIYMEGERQKKREKRNNKIIKNRIFFKLCSIDSNFK